VSFVASFVDLHAARPVLKHGVSAHGCALLAVVFSFSLFAQQPTSRRADWAVPNAALRIEAAVRERPAEADLGVYLQIPDGGILPAHPAIDVRDAAGRPLESLLLWHTPADAMGIVFRPPESGDGEVSIYIRAASALPPKPAATTLKPSLFVFTRSGSASLENARKMASEWPPAKGAFGGLTDRIGIRWNPFGPNDQFSTWFTGWFKLDARETLYFATISDEGSEVLLDGALLADWPGLHTRKAGAKGQFGKSVTLDPGWHRIDYYHFEVEGDQEMCLVWKRGRAGKDELPAYMEGSAWGRTGRAEPLRITAADGRVVGWVAGNLQADGYLWTGSNPVNRHILTCNGVGADDGIRIAWDFGRDRIAGGGSCAWLVSGGSAAEPTAILSVASPAGVSRQTFRLASFTSPRAHALGSPADRLLFRQTFLGMVEAVPADKDPCAAWNGDLWSTFAEVLEPYKGGPILLALFSRGWKTLQTLPVGQRHLLEDRLAETLRLEQDTVRQLAWIDRLEQNERDRARQFRWREERIACHLYDRGDVESARRAARQMRESASRSDEIQRALLRLGDVEHLAGDREQAARFYAEAQTRYRSNSRLGGAAAPPRFELLHAIPAGEAANRAPRSLRSTASDLKRSDAWKLYAVNDAAQSATIRAYLEQNALEEAFAALAQWENDTPLSKIDGDLLMTEARVYFQAGDFRRAAAILAACLRVDVMTSRLPEAMDLHLEALMRLKRIPEARTLAEAALKRFPGLPVAERAARILAETGK
jgi:tetratricopeptide (TPR) repeat protein